MNISSVYYPAKEFIRFLTTGNSGFKNYDITNRCNLQCDFCYIYNQPDNFEFDEVTDEKFIEFFHSEKKNNVHTAILTGGEPALRINLIKAADKIFPVVFIFSNGLIKIDSSIRRRIFISLDGPKEIHNKMRGCNCFERIIDNITDDRRVIVTTLLNSKNYPYITDLYEVLKTKGISGLTFSMHTSEEYYDPAVLRGAKLDRALTMVDYLRKKDPSFVLVSKEMIKQFKEKNHIPNCMLRKGYIISHKSDLSVKSPCVFGKNIDCRTCGCSSPVILHSLKKLDIETFRIISRFYYREKSPAF